MAKNNNYEAFDENLHKVLNEARKKIVKITKNLKQPGLDYNLQFAIDCMHPSRYIYAAWIQPPNNRTSRIEFLATSTEELFKQLDNFAEKVDDIAVEVTWHEAEILACEETIKEHKKRIEELVEEKQERMNNVESK